MECTGNTFIVNFKGIGNGVTFMPLLKCLEQAVPGVRYFHIENPLFDIPAAMSGLSLKGLQGVVPSRWRLFLPEDWEAILAFLLQNRVDTVVNLRNLGIGPCPIGDTNYFEFKETVGNGICSFVDIMDPPPDCHRCSGSSLSQMRRILSKTTVNLTETDPTWLRKCLISAGMFPKRQHAVGLFTGVAQEAKKWPEEQWIELGQLLLTSTNLELSVFAGVSDDENAAAKRIYQRLAASPCHTSRCHLLEASTLSDLITRLAALKLVVTPDTCTAHIARALDLPTVAIYIATDYRVWGYVARNFISLQNAALYGCEEYRERTGNCLLPEGNCPSPCVPGVPASEVFSATMRLFESYYMEPAACESQTAAR